MDRIQPHTLPALLGMLPWIRYAGPQWPALGYLPEANLPLRVLGCRRAEEQLLGNVRSQ